LQSSHSKSTQNSKGLNREPSVLVFTATYNEVDNVEALVAGIWKHCPEAQVLVVDDNSPDGTGELLEQIKLKREVVNLGSRAIGNGGLEVIHRPRKLGLGTAHKLAFQYAREKDFDVFISMDADFSHNPKYIPKLLELLNDDNDFVIGSRYVEGGSCDYTGWRMVVSRLANFAAQTLLGLKLHESTTSFRGFNKNLITSLDLDSIRQNGYSFFLEAVYRISLATPRIVEFPIHFEDRRMGTTKISKAELRKGVFTLFRLTFGRLGNFLTSGKATQRKSSAANYEKENCNNCSCPYSVELYPASVTSHDSVQYNCTSFHHSSHGRIVRCLGCNLVYTSPRLNKEAIESLYEEVEDKTYIANIEAREATFSYNFKKLEPFLSRNCKVLDVGSYCGVFLNVISKLGYKNVSGIEPSSWACRHAKEQFGLEVSQGTLDSLPATEKFDVITSWDVMEHFSDPASELSKIWDRLEKGGVLAFSTLDTHNWFPRLAGERWPWYMDMHLFYFSDPVMRDILKRGGFEVIESTAYCHIITAKYLLMKLDSLGIPFVRSIAQSKIGNTLQRLQVPFKFGDIKLYICKKVDKKNSTDVLENPELLRRESVG